MEQTGAGDRNTSEALDLLVFAGMVLTMDSERRILDPGFIGIHGGRIVMIGPGSPPAGVSASQVIDARGGTVHPGLIDAHAHVGWALARCFVPERYSEEEVLTRFDAPMLKVVTGDDEWLGTQLACLEMALNGTTCFADTGSARDDLAPTVAAVEKSGIRGMVALLIGDSAEALPGLALPTSECLRRIADALSHYPLGPRGWACAGLVGMETASDELVAGTAELAARAGVPLNLHKSFTPEETAIRRARLNGRDPMEGYADLGVLGPNLTLVHMNSMTDAEVEILARTGPAVVHCPTASLMYGIGGSRHGRFPELLAAGVPTALGTDSVHWQNAWDLTRSMYLAATIHKEARGPQAGITAEQALEMATIHAASAVGRSSDLGSLEVGKLADVVIHSRERPEAHPSFDPVGSLVFSGQARTVRTVLVGGIAVVEEGRPTQVDPEELMARVDAGSRDLARRLGFTPTAAWPVIRSAPHLSGPT